MKQILLTCACTLFYLLSFGQLETPAPSPMHTSTQKVGLTEISLEYSRPGVKGREIFGGLLPNDKIWRTGANASTKVSFSKDVMIGGKTLEAGKYALYTIPGDEEWTVIFHKNTSHWGVGDYKESEDAVRIKIEPQTIEPSIESMIIIVNNIRNSSASIDIMWENTLVSIPFKLMTDKQVDASINKVMNGPSSSDYYAAARYYFEEDKDLSKALGWVNSSLEKGGEKFWILRLKSLIQSKLGDYKSAIESAKRSAQLAKEAGNDSYVKMNNDKIAEWMDKL